MKNWTAVLALGLVSLSSWASEPGQPLDCDDWVFLEPGFSCFPWIPFGYEGASGSFLRPGGIGDGGSPTNLAIDNTGAQYRYDQVFLGDGTCGPRYRTRLLRYDGKTDEQIIAYMDDRCPDASRRDEVSNPNNERHLTFDDKNGRLLVSLKSRCIGAMPPCEYTESWWVAAIAGFATTFEILQTYTPTDAMISFTVPYMPEGLRAADYFDTYWGDLATVGDWSQAKPLKCGYPASPPSVGDYLTVEDTLPPPARGAGYYYVTAAHYQGQTRYGRKSSGGKLTGRDPALLPACE